MKLHNLKIKDNFYWDVERGYKTFELRKDDRDYEVYDCIHFIRVDGSEFLNNPNNIYTITYILRNCKEYGLEDGYCILGIKKQKEI